MFLNEAPTIAVLTFIWANLYMAIVAPLTYFTLTQLILPHSAVLVVSCQHSKRGEHLTTSTRLDVHGR